MFEKKDRFVTFIQELNDYPGGWNAVFAMLDSWTKSTDAAYDAFLDEVSNTWNIKEYAPWDVKYVRHQSQVRLDQKLAATFLRTDLPQRLRSTLAGLGFVEEEHGLRFSSKPRLTAQELATLVPGSIVVCDHANPHLRQFGRYHDFSQIGFGQIETNLSEDGLDAYRILWHEVGHAMHHVNIRSKYQSLRTAFPDYFAEALAQVFEFIAIDAKWLQDVCQVEPDVIALLRRTVLSLELQKARENAMWAFYENEVSANPESLRSADVWAGLAGRFLYPRCSGLDGSIGAHEYEERLVHFPYSALQILLTVLIREHLRHALSEDGTMFNPHAGATLKEIYRFGGSRHWTEVVQSVTGKSLTGETAAIGFNALLESAQ